MRTTVEIDGPAVMARVHGVIEDGRGFYERLLERNGVLRRDAEHGRRELVDETIASVAPELV